MYVYTVFVVWLHPLKMACTMALSTQQAQDSGETVASVEALTNLHIYLGLAPILRDSSYATSGH